MKIFKSYFTIIWYLIAFAHIGLTFLIQNAAEQIDPLPFQIVRYLLIAFLFLISFKRKKLSYWIFSSMILGIEVGMDFPDFAMEMERFGKIFLRLIKSLVAPLIFATLVIGIAGHSNLKQLGRIGLKSILYFELVELLLFVLTFYFSLFHFIFFISLSGLLIH